MAAGLGAGAVFAYFAATGHGTGSATNGTAPTVTIQAVASGSPNSTLLPGSTADLLVQVQNPSNFTLTIVGIAQNGRRLLRAAADARRRTTACPFRPRPA